MQQERPPQEAKKAKKISTLLERAQSVVHGSSTQASCTAAVSSFFFPSLTSIHWEHGCSPLHLRFLCRARASTPHHHSNGEMDNPGR